MFILKVKTDIDTYVHTVYSASDYPYTLPKIASSKGRRKDAYFVAENVFLCYDIETTSDHTETGEPIGFMYQWQISVAKRDPRGKLWSIDVIMGRTWEEFLLFRERFSDAFHAAGGEYCTVWVHNLAFEFAFTYPFMSEHLTLFSRNERDVIRITEERTFEWRCSYALTNMTLAKACENSEGVTHFKASGDLDYRKKHTPDTSLTRQELGYCFNDVYGLAEVIISKLSEDTFSTMPYTSTGYVRRDMRHNCRKDPKYREWFLKTKPTGEQYDMLRRAFMGGDTHYNRKYHGKTIVGRIESRDFTSAYPSQMVRSARFPVGAPRWLYWDVDNQPPRSEVIEECAEKCVIMEIIYKNVSTDNVVPYLHKSKAYNALYEEDKPAKGIKANCTVDNGRILWAEMYHTYQTDVDFQITLEQYSYDDFQIIRAFEMDRGYLPEGMRDTVVDFFEQKTTLDGIPEKYYFYCKSKNRINACYGMMASQIDHCTIIFNRKTGKWETEPVKDVDKAINEYYKGKNSFLPYQLALYVTALVRKDLHELIDACGENFLYCDTDSVKFIYSDEIIEKMNDFNELVKAENAACGKRTSAVKPDGIEKEMGLACYDGSMLCFRSYGAKKYCYVDDSGKFHLTLAGVNKKKGADYLMRKSAEQLGIDLQKATKEQKTEIGKNACLLFDLGFIFPESDSGRTTSEYIVRDISPLTYGGCTFTSAGGVCITDTTYTLGVTEGYLDILGLSDEWKTYKETFDMAYGKKRRITLYESEGHKNEFIFT